MLSYASREVTNSLGAQTRTPPCACHVGQAEQNEYVGPQLDHSTDSTRRGTPETELRDVAVLIVDDDPDGRDMLAALVERDGYSVATASNGQEALEMLHVIRPQMILLDVCMPVLDGHRFREEQRHHKEWLAIPTVVMTGAAEEPMLDMAVVKTLRKPVHARELLELVAAHCARA
jgi:CheY-like chemotaxis protein